MLDFLMIAQKRNSKRPGVIEVYPKFIVGKHSDLMVRGGDFYAVWNEERGLWSTDEFEAIRLIDKELDEYAETRRDDFRQMELEPHVLHLWDAESGMVDRWHRFCQKQLRDCFHPLDERIIFSNTETKKEDYASRKLPYPLTEGVPKAWNRLMSVLYPEDERQKIEWAIGAVVTGDSKKIQKFLTLYGSVGTGKSTVIGIIQKLFEGYYCVFEAKNLGSANNAFALEAFRNNPLVAIQHDGDLSRIEDNTRLNSLVSHEEMTVNEKFKSAYSVAFNCFLFMGTNKPVKITDAKSGLMRRLIDVTPSGDKLPPDEYDRTMAQIDFELGEIAWRCRNVYLKNRRAYDDYIPVNMLQASNDFYNFMEDSLEAFQREDGVTAAAAWEMYKTYCDEAKVAYPLSKRPFREELKNYFRDYEERHTTGNGARVRSWYSGLRMDKFEGYFREEPSAEPKKRTSESWLKFDCTESLLDKEYSDCPAQYASDKGTPLRKWEGVTSKLSELDTSRLHYVMPPSNHIFVDFDIPDESGGKSFERNLEAARAWPPTYAELSKSGSGIHLHYIYAGDVTKLAKLYAENVEIKVFSGKSSLRRRLTKCNDIPIATLSSGLPLKGERAVVNEQRIKSEKGLRRQIERNLNKEIHPDTHSSVNFIAKILDDAYDSGLAYDVTDMRNDILAFAAQSTNHSQDCVRTVSKMKFKSADEAENLNGENETLVFFDVEVFPNLFVVCHKEEGEGKSVVKMINPSSTDIEALMRCRLVGFNNRKYDNHILYGAFMGYSPEQLYHLSQRIINEGKGFFGEAYNVSYTDIYDFSSKKQSLKKFEIELGIHHVELGLPWDKPVDEKLWGKVADYCANDVIATEATFKARKADFTARQILADVAGMSVNDTTNSLTTRIIFGGERKPQSQFNYRNMGAMGNSVLEYSRFHQIEPMDSPLGAIDPQYSVFDLQRRPIFPGYKYENGKSTYRGEEVGEGGYVYAEPGIYTNVALLDVASMHPSSIIAEDLFGPYTARYKDILDARLAIKHGEFERAKTMLGGALAKYLDDKDTAADLAQALKIAMNSVYGLTSAKFDNPFRDIRNVDNIVAKRGALFMVNLKHEVQNRGYTVAHIKTDSIKIPDATPEIISFVSAYGKLYGYTFEHEATYDRMCLVNDAVYIAKYAKAEDCEKRYGYVPEKCAKKGGQWTATGTQFAVPYVFKTLFTHEEIGFDGLCETKSVQKGALYLNMNESLPDVTELEKRLEKEADHLKSDEGLALEEAIAKGHDYHFIGKVGQFCPMKPGTGGGILLRKNDDKYYAVTGTKGYRWMESETVRILGKDADVDLSYYRKLADEAKAAIAKYGDFDAFVSSEPYEPDEGYLPF